MVRILVALVPLALLGACGVDEQPCERYVDYICTCHADDTGFDCAELQRTFERADPEVQNSCALELSEQREEDEEAGLECQA